MTVEHWTATDTEPVQCDTCSRVIAAGEEHHVAQLDGPAFLRNDRTWHTCSECAARRRTPA